MIQRIRSKFGNDVFFAQWECALNGKHPLFFAGLLEVSDIRFFLEGQNESYVVTIPRRSVFRLADETHHGVLREVLTEAEGEPPLAKNEVWNRKAWKAWNTPFLKDFRLMFLDFPNEEDQFQYIILTEDESPEFVCYAPKIEVFPPGKTVKTMKKLFEEDMKKREKKCF